MSKENTIEHLVQDLKPVTPWSKGKVASITLSILSLYLCIFFFFGLPPRGAFFSKLEWFSFFGMIFFPIFLMIAGLLASIESSLLNPYFKQKFYVFSVSLITFSIFLYFLFTFTYSLQFLSKMNEIQIQPYIDGRCALITIGLSIPVLIGMQGLMSKIQFYHQKWISFLSLIISISIGLMIMNTHCPYDLKGHHMMGHGLFVLLFSLCLFPLAILFFKKLSNV